MKHGLVGWLVSAALSTQLRHIVPTDNRLRCSYNSWTIKMQTRNL